MTAKWIANALGIVCLLTTAPSGWGGNLITNGSFSNIAGNPTSNGSIGNGANTPVVGWTGGSSGALDCYVVTSTNQFCGYATFVSTASASPDGGNFLMFDADPNYGSTLAQTITGLTKGQNYELSFYNAATYQGGGSFTGQTNLSFSVTWSDGTKSTTLTGNSPNPTTKTSGWKEVFLTFTATSTSETITFKANGLSGGPPVLLLDGVQLNAVPEPAEWTLVACGGLLLFLCTKFKKRST